MTTKPKGVMIVGMEMPDKKISRLYQTWINMRRIGKHQATISWMVRKLGYNEALIKIKDIICLQEVE